MQKNLSWGTLTATSTTSAKYWLKWMAGLWVNATHGSGESEAEAAYQAAVAAIEAAGVAFTGDECNAEIQRLYEALARLADALRGLDPSNPVDIRAWVEGDGDNHLRLSWDGAWTRGRYVRLSYEPRNFPTLFLEWDTGTGEESSFLGLPSAAVKFAAEYVPEISTDKVEVAPLVSVQRLAAQKLGVDVSGVPEQGRQADREATLAIEAHVLAARQAAEAEIRASAEKFPWLGVYDPSRYR